MPTVHIKNETWAEIEKKTFELSMEKGEILKERIVLEEILRIGLGKIKINKQGKLDVK